jgi:hypothetical protein
VVDTNMKRLVVFGCSSTYGQGLPDCPTGEEKPSKLGWPSLLSKELGLDCVNTSTCGAPNKKILLQLLNFPFNKNDMVITLWSFHHRGYIFENPSKAESMMITDESSKEFYLIHNEYDMCVDMTMYMHHARQHLSNLNIRNFHFYFDPVMNKHVTSKKNIVSVTADFVSYEKLEIDKANDNIHIGVRTHENVARFIFNKIQSGGKI